MPFVYQSELSGINQREPHDIVWYYRTFTVQAMDSQRVVLHFGAVDYEADVFVNGCHVTNHQGGHTSFEVDITDYLVDGQQAISVRAFDPHADESIPRGKQFWETESAGIWYTNSTGIWQPVWLEVVSETYLKEINLTPNLDEGTVTVETILNQFQPQCELDYRISFKEQLIAAGRLSADSAKMKFNVDLFQEHIFRSNFHHDGWSWTPENPQLFDIKLSLINDGETIDYLKSYFGMRKIHTENGMVYLNNKPYYQKVDFGSRVLA